MLSFLLAVLGLGVAGLDPAGALIAIAALTAGARRAAVLGFSLVSVLVTSGLGVALSVLVGTRLTDLDLSFLDLDSPWWAPVEVVVAALLLVWAVRRHVRRASVVAKEPTTRRTGAALLLAGAAFGASAVLDPTFVAVVVLAGRDQPWWAVAVAHLLWVVVSQAPLVVLSLAVAAGRHQAMVAWFQRVMDRWRPTVHRVLTVVIAASGLLLTVDVVVFWTTGDYLLG